MLRQGLRDTGGQLPVKEQILIFLIAQRYKAETTITGEIAVPYSELYTRFSDKGDSTIRRYVMNLRKEGFAKREDDGHRFDLERLPAPVELIGSTVGSN